MNEIRTTRLPTAFILLPTFFYVDVHGVGVVLTSICRGFIVRKRVVSVEGNLGPIVGQNSTWRGGHAKVRGATLVQSIFCMHGSLEMQLMAWNSNSYIFAGTDMCWQKQPREVRLLQVSYRL